MLVTIYTNYKKKFKSCYRTLIEIGVEPDKMIYVLNKSELLADDEVLDRIDYLMLKENKKWIDVSAITGKNMDKLEKIIEKIFQNDKSAGVKTYGN